jgi:translocation and assembly module TamB
LRAGLDQMAITGTLNGSAHASWMGSIRTLRVHCDLALSAAAKNTAPSAAQSAANTIPANGVIHATYDGRRHAFALRQSTLHIPSGTVTANGELSKVSSLSFQAKIADLRQFESLVSVFHPKGSALPPVSGSATLNATLNGSLSRPDVSGHFAAQNLEVQGSQWNSAQASVQASPSKVTVTNGTLVSAQRGRASFNGTVSLDNWHYLPGSPFTAILSVEQMSIADLQHTANLHYPVTGDLSAQVTLEGTQLNPQGSGNIQITHARAYNQPFQQLAAQFHADHATIISSLHVVTPAGSAAANLSYNPGTNAYTLRLDAPALVLQKLPWVQEKNLGLAGILNLSASGQGTIDHPQLSAVLQLPQLTLRDKSISDIRADLQIAGEKAHLTLTSKVLDSSIQARAQVNLTDDYYAEASIQTTVIPLDVLLAAYLPSIPTGFRGQTELHATLKGPLKDITQVEAQITIPTLNASYQSLQIGIASPLHADLVHSVLTVQAAEIRGTDTSLRVQGSIPLSGNAAPRLTAQGSLDVRILKIFSPDTTSSGTVSFDVHASGSAQAPNVSGQILLHDVALLYSGAPVGVSKLNGTLDIAKESIQISKLSGEVGGGEVLVGGSIVYRPKLQFNVLLRSNSVRLLYPTGLRSVLDSNLSFSGDTKSSTLSGRVLIDSLSFTPDFDLSSFAGQLSGETSIPAEPGVADTIKLAVSVQSKDNLSVNSSQISLEGSVNLRVVGTAANPVITGRTDLISGEVFYRSVRYQLQRGIITFDNPNQTNPVLNVTATTTVEQYNLTLNLSGPFNKLTTSYTSDPPLSTADIINLLAQGQTTEESAAAGQSTDSIIASQAAGQFVGGIQRLAGISSLSIDPLIGGNNQNPSARIALQQRVTKNLLFTFSTDVSQPGSEIVQGNYQINKRWSISVTRDQVGGISVSGELHTKF